MAVKRSEDVVNSVVAAAERMRKVRERNIAAQVAAETEPDTPARGGGAAVVPGSLPQGQPKR